MQEVSKSYGVFTLLQTFSETHNSIYANDGLSAQQALDEMLKVLFIKFLAEK